MQKLRLYKEEPRALIETIAGEEVDPKCTRCDLAQNCRTDYRMLADGTPGGLLVVGDGPDRASNTRGQPFTGPESDKVRNSVERYWKGPVVYDYATRCDHGYEKLKDSEVDACRPYLAATIQEVAPTRVLALGTNAYFAITGRKVLINSLKQAYSYLYTLPHEDPVPVYLLQHPFATKYNKFIADDFDKTMKWALTRPLPPPAPQHVLANLCRSAADTAEAVEILAGFPWVTFDVETAGRAYTPDFVILSLAITGPGPAYTTYQWNRETLDEAMAGRNTPLRKYLTGNGPERRGQFVNYDTTALDLVHNCRVANSGYDTRIHHKLLMASASSAKLESLVEMVGMGGMKEDMEEALERCVAPILGARRSYEKEAEKAEEGLVYRPTKKTCEARLKYTALEQNHPELYVLAKDPSVAWQAWGYALVAEECPDEMARYNCRDTVGTARVSELMLRRLGRDPELDEFRRAIIDRAERANERVQRWGIPTDIRAVEAYDAYLSAQLAPLELWFEANGIRPTNNNDIATYLFTKCKIKPPKILDSGKWSTDQKVLEGLKHENADVQRILDFRKYDGFRTKYARGMRPFIRNGRIHPTIWLDGARTGRTSCSDPPLQQIPKRTAEGKMARGIFAAESGFEILSLDYSQLELRITALLSGDEVMTQIFEDGVDYHQRTAELICEMAWGISIDQLTAFHRDAAKTLNFSMLYGAGDSSVALKISAVASKIGLPAVTAEDVARIRAAVLSKLKRLDAYIKETVEACKRTGEVRTWWDGKPARRRQLWDIGEASDSSYAQSARAKAARAAFNTRIQGTANDFCLASMADLVEWIEAKNLSHSVQLVLPVHDQLLFHVKKSMTRDVARKAREVMTSHNSGNVPLVVDIEVGGSWGTLEKMDVVT